MARRGEMQCRLRILRLHLHFQEDAVAEGDDDGDQLWEVEEIVGEEITIDYKKKCVCVTYL